MREKKHKIIKWIVVNLVAAPLVLLGVFTGYSHFKTGMYSFESWEIVWPAMVSTLIAVFGTLVTSYVFLKDALDRTIDEKPYYKKIIERYRQEKTERLILYSIIFLGISGYLILFQHARKEGLEYNLFLYIGIIAVVILLLFSLHFLYQCISIDKSICKSAEYERYRLNVELEKEWKRQEIKWKQFVKGYTKKKDGGMKQFLELKSDEGFVFDKDRFIVKFSEWEKFIFLFLDRSSGFQMSQSVEQRIAVATEYITKFHIVQDVEQKDAEDKDWESYAYGHIQQYIEMIEDGDDERTINRILGIYQLLSDYRDALQVIKEKKVGAVVTEHQIARYEKKINKKTDETCILYTFFLLKFYISLKCLVTLPKVEIFYPSAKMDNVDFYNVRFENSSFRAALFREVLFARIKMIGSNMAFSRFESCNFYNADIRDCSISNSYFEKCLLSEMILSDIDATGAEFECADLTETTFDSAIIVNVVFNESKFFYTNFLNSKLAKVKFTNVIDRQMRHSSFEKSVMKEVEFYGEGDRIIIPERCKEYNSNYFREQEVSRKSKGRKERQELDIWNSLKDESRYKIDMRASSFAKATAEKIKFQNMCLDHSVFSDTDLQESQWRNVCMQGCVMDEVNLTETSFDYVDAESCVMAGGILYNSKFDWVNLQNSNLLGCHASGSKWRYCVFDKSDISSIDLTKSEIEYSAFRDMIMTEAELTYAQFSDVLFDNSNGRGLLSSYSKFDQCSFVNAYFPSSNFNYTVFEKCDMTLASITGSTIEEAEFIGCKLENGNFRECCFIKVKFRDNKNISREIFEGSTFISCVFEGDNDFWGRLFEDDPKHYTFIA